MYFYFIFTGTNVFFYYMDIYNFHYLKIDIKFKLFLQLLFLSLPIYEIKIQCHIFNIIKIQTPFYIINLLYKLNQYYELKYSFISPAYLISFYQLKKLCSLFQNLLKREGKSYSSIFEKAIFFTKLTWFIVPIDQKQQLGK